MKTTILKICAFVLLLTLMCAGCKKDEQSVTITLHDQPLSVIQSYIEGKWKLQYSFGGLIASKYIDKNNSYMILRPEHIIIGNDSKGVVVDTNIVWIRTDIGTNDTTYLLSYSLTDTSTPEYYIVNQIKNDTLIIREYVNDGYSYYYTK